MHSQEISRIYASGGQIINQVNPISAKLVRTQPNADKPIETKPGGAVIPDGTLLLISICSIMVFAIVGFMLSGASKVTHDRRVSIKDFTQAPCRTCRFFTNNPYLKCAVHPSTVLSTQAINCSDYSPQNGRG